MREAIAAAQAGAYDVLVVAYVDRWQRNLRQTLNVLEDELHPAGVAVWFCDEEILSSCERNWDHLVDLAKAAESWLRRHRRRVKEGLAAKLASKRDPVAVRPSVSGVTTPEGSQRTRNLGGAVAQPESVAAVARRNNAEASPVARVRQPVHDHTLHDRRGRAFIQHLEQHLEIGTRTLGHATKAAVLLVGHEAGDPQVVGTRDDEVAKADAVDTTLDERLQAGELDVAHRGAPGAPDAAEWAGVPNGAEWRAAPIGRGQNNASTSSASSGFTFSSI